MDFKKSKFWLSFERVSGDDKAAVIALRIPKHDSIVSIEDELRRQMEANGFMYCEEKDSFSLIAKVLIPVEDIWHSASGAKAAHAARIYLSLSDIPPNARFDYFFTGPVSRRM